MSEDPLESLLGQLLEAHDRQQAAHAQDTGSTPPAFKPWRWRLHRRFLAVSAAALVLCASAAAGVVISSDYSAPLSGLLPKQLLGSRYGLTVTRDAKGSPGVWCIQLTELGTKISVVGSGNRRCVRPGNSPLIIRGGLTVVSPQTGQFVGWLLYAIVRKGVAALREPDGQSVTPISNSSLPSDWRAAVVIQVDPRHNAGGTVTLTPIDRQGRTLIL
jgi:hypothetical protein